MMQWRFTRRHERQEEEPGSGLKSPNPYTGRILALLAGENQDHAALPIDRLDWQGVSDVLELYDQSVGPDREKIVGAMGHILETADEHPIIAAQVLSMINGLGLQQLHPSVEKLIQTGAASHDALRREIDNYFAFLKLAHAADG